MKKSRLHFSRQHNATRVRNNKISSEKKNIANPAFGACFTILSRRPVASG